MMQGEVRRALLWGGPLSTFVYWLLAGVPTCACLAGAMTATWGLLVPMMLFVARKSEPLPGKPRVESFFCLQSSGVCCLLLSHQKVHFRLDSYDLWWIVRWCCDPVAPN